MKHPWGGGLHFVKTWNFPKSLPLCTKLNHPLRDLILQNKKLTQNPHNFYTVHCMSVSV